MVVAVLLAAAVALPLAARSLSEAAGRRAANWLALGLVVYRTGWIVKQLVVDAQPLLELLPFHICGLLFYLCAWMLWKRSYAAYEVAYFWAMGGALQAILTPAVRFGCPDADYIANQVSHAALLLAVFYAMSVYGFRPRLRSVAKALAATVACALVILPFNMVFGTNYMYLLAKPKAASLLDYLGPWPWYIVNGVGVAGVTYLVWYLPFAPWWSLGRQRNSGGEDAGT